MRNHAATNERTLSSKLRIVMLATVVPSACPGWHPTWCLRCKQTTVPTTRLSGPVRPARTRHRKSDGRVSESSRPIHESSEYRHQLFGGFFRQIMSAVPEFMQLEVGEL